MFGEFDPKRREPLLDDSEVIPREQTLKSLEARLVVLIEEISKCDERLAHIKQTRTKYRKLVDESPNDETLADEVRDLGTDLALLIESRGHLVEERQDVREQIRALAGAQQRQQSPANLDAKSKLQAKLEDLTKHALEGKKNDAAVPEIGIQPELDFLAELDKKDEAVKAEKQERERPKLLPARYTNRDFFIADIFGYSLKDDAATMEAPIYSLMTQKDFSIWRWASKDGSRSVEVSPSALYGRATMHDKDVLIFITSQMTEALNRERPDAQNRAVRFTVHNYLVATNKPTGGVEYKRLETALDRLKGTTIKTSIRTGDKRVKEAFGIIDSWTIVERSPNDERMIAVEIVMSKWLFNAIQAHEVLTLHPDYFRLRKPLERRLYELARKHCGSQSIWKIGLELLREKCGAQSHIRAFRNQIQDIADADTLPEYRMVYSKDADQVIFYVKNAKKLLVAINSGKSPLSNGR